MFEVVLFLVLWIVSTIVGTIFWWPFLAAIGIGFLFAASISFGLWIDWDGVLD